MKLNCFIYVFLIFYFSCSDIGDNYNWNSKKDLNYIRNFGTIGYDYGWSGDYSPFDNGVIITGSQQKNISGQRDMWAIKTNDRGMLVWDKTFGGTNDEDGYDVISTSDGGFLFVGFSWSFGNEQQAYAVKTDYHGNVEWERTYGGSMWEVANAVIETRDGSYMIVGYSNSPGISSGNTDIMLLKISDSGEKIWLKTYGNESFPNHEWGNDIIQIFDDGFIIVGSRDRYQNGAQNELILRIDKDGVKIWEKEIMSTGQSNEIAYSITNSQIGEIFVTSSVNNENKKSVYKPKIIRMDASGNVEWSRVFESNSFSNHQFRSSSLKNGNLILVGSSNINTPFGKKDDAFITQLDNKGNILWTQAFGTNEEDDWGWTVFEKNIGEIIMIGSTKSFNSSLFDIFMLSTNIDVGEKN